MPPKNQHRKRLSLAQAQNLISSLGPRLRQAHKASIVKTKQRRGELNFNWLLRGKKGRMFVLSIPRKNPKIMHSLDKEYGEIGFFSLGGSYRLRTINEIAGFSRQCERHGFVVPQVIEHGSNYLLREFVRGEVYENALRKSNNPEKIALNYLKEIFRAHGIGIVFGDRWGPNEIVLRNGRICFFDFDIKLGRLGKEFELAQTVYYSILFSSKKEATASAIIGLLKRKKSLPYKWKNISLLLLGHCLHFANHPQYGGIEKHVKRIAQSIG